MIMYQGLELSTRAIEKTGWKVSTPLQLQDLDIDAAEHFINKDCKRDLRINWDGDCLRCLVVHLEPQERVAIKDPVLQTAFRKGWIPAEFVRLLGSGNAGTSLLWTADRRSLFLQLPKDGNGLVTMILTCLPSVRPNTRCQPQTDWACIILASDGLDLESLLTKDPFPNDYTRMPADFMILPVSLFRWRVELLVEELENLTRNVVNEEEQLISAVELSELDLIRKSIFELGKVQLRLRRKWVCTLEVATTLSQYFDAIERKYAEEEVAPRYSEILRQRVRMDAQICGSLEYDLQIIPSKIDSQRQMIDSRFHMMIAQSSAKTAEESQKDSSSMKTMSIMTLIFLPGTSIASIFSMGVFNWDAKDVRHVGNQYLWLYFAIAIPLTIVVLLTWYSWVKLRQRTKEAKKSERDKC